MSRRRRRQRRTELERRELLLFRAYGIGLIQPGDLTDLLHTLYRYGKHWRWN